MLWEAKAFVTENKRVRPHTRPGDSKTVSKTFIHPFINSFIHSFIHGLIFLYENLHDKTYMTNVSETRGLFYMIPGYTVKSSTQKILVHDL